jgi:hypothetical protein
LTGSTGTPHAASFLLDLILEHGVIARCHVDLLS